MPAREGEVGRFCDHGVGDGLRSRVVGWDLLSVSDGVGYHS